jgi:hypothetical protein
MSGSEDEEYRPSEENGDDPLGLGSEEAPKVEEEPAPEPLTVDKGDVEGK